MRLKEIGAVFIVGLGIAGMIGVVWCAADWDIVSVTFGGLLLYALCCGGIQMALTAAQAFEQHKRRQEIDRRKLEHRRQTKCYIFTAVGQMTSMPTNDPDFVELRNVVTGFIPEQENTLPPSKAMQGVS